jgi:hypothetical protein
MTRILIKPPAGYADDADKKQKNPDGKINAKAQRGGGAKNFQKEGENILSR